ncbi:MAG: response regulator [Gammaproteobacteria bacterium]
MNILIINESSLTMGDMREALCLAGVDGNSITMADNVPVALERIRQNPPDLVVAGWEMERISGLKLLRTIKTQGYQVDFGFVAREATQEMRAKAAIGGAKFLISQPATPLEMSQILGPNLVKKAA